MVTGSEGFIGSKLCHRLQEFEHQVLKVDRRLGVSITNCDYEDVDLIYHLAAQTDVQYSRTHAYEDARDNILATLQLLLKYPDVKIIYPASAASLEINSPYGLSKETAGQYIKLLAKDYVICRLGNIWGGGHGAVDKFIKEDKIVVNGDGHQTRSIIHVDDVVEGFIKAMNWPKGWYSLGGEDLSVKEIAERIGKKMNKPVHFDLTYDPVKEGEVYKGVIPNDTPDWQPQVHL